MHQWYLKQGSNNILKQFLYFFNKELFGKMKVWIKSTLFLKLKLKHTEPMILKHRGWLQIREFLKKEII